MSIKSKLKYLHDYYLINRRVGHTRLLKEGTDNYKGDKFILCYNMEHGKAMGFNPNKEVLSWQSMEKLLGHKKPLAIDNETIIVILDETLKEINKLENEIQKFKEQRKQLIKILNEE